MLQTMSTGIHFLCIFEFLLTSFLKKFPGGPPFIPPNPLCESILQDEKNGEGCVTTAEVLLVTFLVIFSFLLFTLIHNAKNRKLHITLRHYKHVICFITNTILTTVRIDT